jgi:hypothetical protein
MPDIAMCLSVTCPSAAKCYRHEAKPGNRQAYANFAPKLYQVRCEYFMPILETKEASHE